MWIVLATAPLTAAWTVSQTRPVMRLHALTSKSVTVSQTGRPIMRLHALTSITYSGSPSQPLQGRVSVVMQEKSVTPETTAATASARIFNVTRLRKHWGYGLALITSCLYARDSATSSVGGLVQVGFDFVKSNYKGLLIGLLAVVSAHDLLTKWGVYGMFRKIFGVASTEDMNACFAAMNAGIATLNASIRSISETISETVKKDSPEWKDVEAMLWKDAFDRATFAVTQQSSTVQGQVAGAVEYDIVVLDQDGKQPLRKKLPKTLRCVLTQHQPAAQGGETSLVLEARMIDHIDDTLVRHIDVTSTILGQLTHLSGKQALPRFSVLKKSKDFRESGRYELSLQQGRFPRSAPTCRRPSSSTRLS